MSPSIILASKSPRRKEILQDLGFHIRIFHSNIKEVGDSISQTIEEKVISIARKKAIAVSSEIDGGFSKEVILASDTVVCLGDDILGKPRNRKEAYHMLKKLSGNKHTVITATVILDNNRALSYEVASTTIVEFKQLSEEVIQEYLDQNMYMDKAGAYGIQSNGDQLVNSIHGDYFNVMGLSVKTVVGYFEEYYNEEISTAILFNKHGSLIRKFKSDGDNDEQTFFK